MTETNYKRLLQWENVTIFTHSRLRCEGEAEVPDNQDILEVRNCQELLLLLHICQNWVDISLLEQLVKASGSTTAAAIVAEYKKAHRPDTKSCILQTVLKTEKKLLNKVLDHRDYHVK